MRSLLNHRKFLRDRLICLPTFDRPDGICDFVFQVARDLAHQNVVIILALGENWRGITGLKKWLRVIHRLRAFHSEKQQKEFLYLALLQLLPFQRSRVFQQLNLKLNMLLLSSVLRLFFERRSRILWIFHPNDAKVLPAIDLSKWHVHVDCVDWHTSANANDSEQLHQQRLHLYKVAQTVTVLTKPAAQRVRKFFTKKIAIVPQGFDATSLSPSYLPARLITKLIQQLQRKRKPIVGYFGGINARLDLDLLEEVISNAPQLHFVFVGPRDTDDSVPHEIEQTQQLDRILRLPNLSYQSRVSRKDLYALMQNCAALIVPYALQYEFNKCCFPMKVIEYFYAERPVVSTSIPSLAQYKNLVTFADTPEQFLTALNTSVGSQLSEVHKRQAHQIAIGQTWTAKLDSVDVYLDKMLRSA